MTKIPQYTLPHLKRVVAFGLPKTCKSSYNLLHQNYSLVEVQTAANFDKLIEIRLKTSQKQQPQTRKERDIASHKKLGDPRIIRMMNSVRNFTFFTFFCRKIHVQIGTRGLSGSTYKIMGGGGGVKTLYSNIIQNILHFRHQGHKIFSSNCPSTRTEDSKSAFYHRNQKLH